MFAVLCGLVWTGSQHFRRKSVMKSTSSVVTRIDGFIIGTNSQLQDTRAQSSGESEFCALGAGCTDGLYVKAILNDLGMRAKINLRCDAKAARALAQRQSLSKRTRHVKVPQGLDGKELRERHDVTSRHWRARCGIRRRFRRWSTRMMLTRRECVESAEATSLHICA